MSRLTDCFRELDENREGGYIPYICAGDPNSEMTLKMIETLCDSGADIIELGIPFSDPMADGPILQEAMIRSLKGGFQMESLFGILDGMRDMGLDQPVVVMGYYNIIHRMGEGEFCRRLSEAGCDGMIVVDLPLEENGDLDNSCMENDLDLVNLITPNTPFQRRKRILEGTRGYVYLVSTAGVTGPREGISDETLAMLKEISNSSPVPVALGFGISGPEQASLAYGNGAKAVVEGSRIASIYSPHVNDMNAALESLGRHASMMKEALRNNDM